MKEFEIKLESLLKETNSYRRIVGLPELKILDLGCNDKKETVLLVQTKD